MDDNIELLYLYSGVATSRVPKGYTMKLPRECLTFYQDTTFVI